MSFLAVKRRLFTRDRRGSAAIEFAIVSLPFLALVMAIMECSVEFYLNNSLDRAVQNLANQIRSGTVQLGGMSASTLRANYICPTLPAGVSCTDVAVSLFSANCATDGTCWSAAGYGSGYANAVRALPSVDASAAPFTVGKAYESQYLAVAYPMPLISFLWDQNGTAERNGVKVRAVIAVAMWINDPSVQRFL